MLIDFSRIHEFENKLTIFLDSIGFVFPILVRNQTKNVMPIVVMKSIERISGMIDGLVFRTVNGVIIMSKRPRFRKGKQSELQQYYRDKFRKVSAEVKRKLLNPEVKAHYKREAERLKLPNAYTAALKEGMANSRHDSSTALS